MNYLTLTGSQYFTTDYYPNNNTVVKTKAYVTANNIASQFLTRWNGSPNYDSFGFIYSTVGTFVFYYGRYGDNYYTTVSSSSVSKNTEYDIELNIDTVKFDTNTYNITRGTFTAETPVVLGTFYNIANPSYSLKGRLYRVTFKENNTVVRDFVPVKRKSDDVYGVYDIVSGTFISNGGSGTITDGGINVEAYEIYTDGTTETIEDSL